jgi:PHD/YefM family antitoxin component YafN of YafNO toxin-antitoxin module
MKESSKEIQEIYKALNAAKRESQQQPLTGSENNKKQTDELSNELLSKMSMEDELDEDELNDPELQEELNRLMKS